jgi:hypothetical protein
MRGIRHRGCGCPVWLATSWLHDAQSHQTTCEELAPRASGSRSPLRVGCNSAASVGCLIAIERDAGTRPFADRRPRNRSAVRTLAQMGHAAPLVRVKIIVSHSCPHDEHFHHTLRLEPAAIAYTSSSALRVG